MKKLTLFLSLLCLTLTLVMPASALEFNIAAPEGYHFARPTSDDTIYRWQDPNVDRSKDTALLPLSFGTHAALPYFGELMIPSFVAAPGSIGVASAPAFTEATPDLRYPDGSLGVLTIPRLGVSVPVFEGTDSATLKKGAGHFEGTSIWDGNVALAGHNRGVNAIFGQIHTLNAGDAITLTTLLGTRAYAVVGVEKVLETDTSGLASTVGNQLTLYTCVRDQPAYRWRVWAVEMTC